MLLPLCDLKLYKLYCETKHRHLDVLIRSMLPNPSEDVNHKYFTKVYKTFINLNYNAYFVKLYFAVDIIKTLLHFLFINMLNIHLNLNLFIKFKYIHI